MSVRIVTVRTSPKYCADQPDELDQLIQQHVLPETNHVEILRCVNIDTMNRTLREAIVAYYEDPKANS